MSYTVHCPRMPATYTRATWQEWGQSCEISPHDKGILWRHPEQRTVIPSRSVCPRCVFGFGHLTQQEWHRADISDLDDVHRNICQTLSARRCVQCFPHKSYLILTVSLQEGSITPLLPYTTQRERGFGCRHLHAGPGVQLPGQPPVLFPCCTALRSCALKAKQSQPLQLRSALRSEWRGWQGALVCF